MSCSIESTKNWLKKEGFISNENRVIDSLQSAIDTIKKVAIKKFKTALPESVKYNDILYKNKNGNIGFYRPFFEWVDKKNIERNTQIEEARKLGIEDAKRAGKDYTDKYLFFQTSKPIDSFQEEFNKKLKERLEKFIKALNITIKENDDDLLESLNFEKGTPLAAFDMLQKYLSLGSNITNKELTLQTANILYSFLGKKSLLGVEIWKSIENWNGYQKIYDRFSKEQIEISEDIEYSKENFNPFAHKQAIIHLIAEMLEFGIDNKYIGEKRINPDLSKEFFESQGFRDKYAKNIFIRNFNKLINWINEKFLNKVAVHTYSEKKLKEVILDIVDDIYKEDYKKFLRNIYVDENGKILNEKGEVLEQKFYEDTLNKDTFAKNIIETLFGNPFLNYKLSGSQVTRKYGRVLRSVNEDLHDIDGIIPLDTFLQEPTGLEFVNWLRSEGLKLNSKRDNKFFKTVKPKIEEMVWYKNIKYMFPTFVLEKAFIGKDHKNAESVTITGYIPHPTKIDPETGTNKKYILDFFLRVSEGNYPEIYDNYWKDWKQIFEAKINMGRSKDIFDLIYFEPFIQDKYKFTNKGFRYFTFAEKESPTSLKLTGKLQKPSFNSQKEYYLSNSTNKILNNIVKFGDEDSKKLAEALLKVPLIDKINFKVIKYDKDVDMSSVLGRDTMAAFSPTQNSVKVVGNLPKQLFETAVLHEFIHAITYNEFETNKEFNEKMNTLYKHALKFEDRYTSIPGKTLGSMYGMQDVHEFMAEAMTNPDFIYELNKYYSPIHEKTKNKSIFKEFIDLITNMIKAKLASKNKKFIPDNLGITVLNTINNYSKIKDFDLGNYLSSLENLVNEKTKNEGTFDIMVQKKGTEDSSVNAQLLFKMKEVAKKMGIKFATLTEYAQQHPNIDLSDVNALADLFLGTIAIADGKESVALTEEIVHIFTAIIEQVNPEIITSLISKINKYKIYDDTFKEYKKNKHYQNSDGKPNIRKIKKEAFDKLLVEVIVKGEQDIKLFPELAYSENLNWIKKVWEDIKQFIKRLYRKSDIDLLKQIASNISEGNINGTISDINSKDIYLQIENNSSVDNFYNKMVETSKDIEGPFPEIRDNKGNLIEKRHYKYKGVKVFETVSEKISRNKEFADLPDSEDKKKWGNIGHQYLENYIKTNLIDSNGFKKLKTNTQIPTLLNGSIKAVIEDFAENLINYYPEGTRFLSEIKAINTEVKGKLATTIDFIAIIPTKDKNNNDDFNVEVLDWKFTSFNEGKYNDLSPGKQKSWKLQMGEYVKMLKTNTYKVPSNNIKKARMIPFIANYSYAIPGVVNSGLILNKIEVGKIDNPKETRLYLLPVPIDDESTGFIEIDELVKGLQVQQRKMYKKIRGVKERESKDIEMANIQAAIKKLRLQYDFDPLYNVGKNLTNRIIKVLKDYNKLNFSEMSKSQVNDKLSELLDFKASLEKFINLREIYSNYLSKDNDKLTSEEKVTLSKISNISNISIDLNKEINELQKKFVIEKLIEHKEINEENKEDALKPEATISFIERSFLEGSRLSSRIIKVVSNMILNASSLVNIKINKRIKEYGIILNELEQEAKIRGVKAFDLIGKVNENDLELINKIKKEYYQEQREAIKIKNKKFFINNMNIDSYKEMISKIIKEKYEEIDETIFTSDVIENLNRRRIEKESFKNKIDIFSDDFYGYDNKYFLYIYKQNFLEEKHYSDEFKQLKKIPSAFKVWEFFMTLNNEARDLGYLERKKQSFFPLIEATSLQKLQQTNNYLRQTKDFFQDIYLSRINEDYNENIIDPETGEVKKSIPKYFIETDKNVEQLSKDLNLVGATWIKSIENYKNAKELEHVLHTMHIVESNKGKIVKNGNKTVYNGSNIVTSKEDNPNANILQLIIDDYLYGKKESPTSGSSAIINFGTSRLTSDEEKQERLGINTRKVIHSSNALIRNLALGLKIPISLANYGGTQFQAFIKSGSLYKFLDYEKSNFQVTFSDLNTLSLQEKAMIELFVPLNEDIALEARRKLAKQQGILKYLSTWTFTDVMMLSMQFPEKKLQLANALAILKNTVIIDNKIENARQYIRRQDRLARKNGADYDERKYLMKTQEKRIKELIEEHGIKNKIIVTDSNIEIPGISDEQIAKYRTMIIDYNRTLNGMMDENDKMGYRRDTLFTSFMMFKSWIPKLVYVRTGELEKNLQTGEWDYGRLRATVKTLLFDDLSKTDIEQERNKSFVIRWNIEVFSRIKRLKDIIYLTDDGIELLNNILYEKRMKHLKEKGQQLEITEEEFQDIMRESIINQFKDLGVLIGVMGTYLAAVIAEPPEDATPLEKNRYKWIYRQIHKLGDEITFYYQPGSMESILQGSFLPAVTLIARVGKFASHLGMEVYGNVTNNKDIIEDAYPIKYLFNLIPILSQAQNEYLPYIDPELAKEMGIRVTKESRKN